MQAGTNNTLMSTPKQISTIVLRLSPRAKQYGNEFDKFKFTFVDTLLLDKVKETMHQSF